MLECKLCGQHTDNYEPIYCCTGSVHTIECGCAGRPVNEDVTCERCEGGENYNLTENDIELMLELFDLCDFGEFDSQEEKASYIAKVVMLEEKIKYQKDN